MVVEKILEKIPNINQVTHFQLFVFHIQIQCTPIHINRNGSEMIHRGINKINVNYFRKMCITLVLISLNLLSQYFLY